MTSRDRLTPQEKRRLVNAVNGLPSMQDPHHRQLVVEELAGAFGAEFDPGRLQTNWSIVNACINRGAMRYLVEVLMIADGASREFQQLQSIVEELFSEPAAEPPTGHSFNQDIALLLQAVNGDALAQAVHHPALQGRLPFQAADVVSGADAYERLNRDTSADGKRTVMLFLEVIAHQLDEYGIVELHRHIYDLTAESDRSLVRQFCRTLQSQSRSDAPAAALHESAEPVELDKASPTPAGEESTPGDDAVKTSQRPAIVLGLTVAMPPMVWGGLPPRNSNFTGREDLLDELHRSLSSNTQTALLPQPLHGLGGVGKSQTAVEFAYRFQFEYELIWWIQADDERSIRRSLVSLARRLGLPQSDDVEDTVDTALDALRLGDPHSRWLLIYDNAPEPNAVQRYLPSGQGHVIITSRSRSWAVDAAAIEVAVFAPEESRELLRARWPELTDEAALTLAERLGHLPLALEQAVAVHSQTGMPLTEYLTALDSSPTAILNEGAPATYAQSVAETLGLAFASLRENSPTAARLLELCAFLSSHPMSIPLLTRGRGAQLPSDLQTLLRDDIPLRRAIRDLGRFALVQLDPARDLLTIHSLVRAVLRDSIPPEQRDTVERHAHAVLALANPGLPDSPATWPLHAQITPHVIPSGLTYSSDIEARHVVLDQIRFLYAIGDYAASRDLGQQAVDIWRASMGPDEELTLVATRHLANSLRALGQNQAARDHNLDTLERMGRTLGKDHEHTLATANSVAADLRLLGHFRQALELDQENLSKHQKVLGAADPGTLRVTGNLAVDCRLLGDFRRAKEIDESSIAMRASVYGEDHPRTLFAHMCLIRDVYGLGDYHNGLAVLQEKLPVYKQKLPSDHGDILLARRLLAMLLRKEGHLGSALHEAQQVFDSHRIKFGRLHEHTLSALVTLSNAYRASGDFASALQHGESALASYQELLGDQHPFTLACKVNVAIALRLLNRLGDALALNDQALDGFRSAFGEDHPHTLCCANNKANVLAASGRKDEARSLSGQTLQRSRTARRENHPNTLMCAANHALDLEDAGEAVQAGALRKEALEGLYGVLGSDHPERVNVSLGRRADCDIEVATS